MSKSRAFVTLVCATALGAGLVVLARGQDGDLRQRVETMVREGRYDLALELLEDRGETLPPDLQWQRARLVRDPDRFDRLALELWNSLDPADSLRARITLARAREHFARGRYETAAEYLRGLPPEVVSVLPEVPLYLGMASQALGEARNAARALESVPPGTAPYAFAQALLADLVLREGRLDEAESHAERTLDLAPRDLGAQALLVRIRVAEQRQDAGRARQLRSRLVDEFPRSAEAAWLGESGVTVETPPGDTEPRFREVEAPVQRRSFAVQFGAFHDRSLALRMAGDLEGRVEDLRIELDRSVEPPWYRVVGGNFVTRSQADAALERLSEAGVEGVVLAPGRGGR